jgi:hypothetical protein
MFSDTMEPVLPVVASPIAASTCQYLSLAIAYLPIDTYQLQAQHQAKMLFLLTSKLRGDTQLSL